MIGAVIFHMPRGEVISIGTNLFKAAVMACIVYGRWKLAPFDSAEPAAALPRSVTPIQECAQVLACREPIANGKMETRVNQRSRFRCSVCGRPAYFFSHSGLLCRNDALLDAVLNGWMPAPIDQRPSDLRTDGQQVA